MNLREFKEWVASIDEDDDLEVIYEGDCCPAIAIKTFEAVGPRIYFETGGRL